MSATVAAALKKIAVYILTDKKVLKVVGGIVLGIIVIIIMPIVAVLGIFNGSIEIDTERLQQMVVENLADEEKEKLQRVEDMMDDIESAMEEAEFSDKVTEAQVLYTLALSDKAHESDFVSKLVGCFAEDQSDRELIDEVNDTFGTSIKIEDFKNMMDSIGKKQINTSGYTDPATKNNLDLVKWAVEAQKSDWGYVYGTYGTVLYDFTLTSKVAQYPDEVGAYEDFIRQHWLGGRTTDCVGLIKGYGWLNAETKEISYCTNGMPDISADTMCNAATEKGTIDTIPEIPGLAVWHEGHIGVYIGGGKVVQAANTNVGVILTNIGDTPWTHWLKVPFINYIETEENANG